MGSNTKAGFLIIVLAAAFAVPPIEAQYPGNVKFRNRAVTFAAQTRTDWVTNVTTLVGSAKNPGVSTPINWSVS